MITFSNPMALLWGLLAAPIVLLYLWGPRPRRQAVATGFLWQRVLGKPNNETTWRRRHGASGGVQAAILALVVLAAAGPWAGRPRRFVLIFDVSARMSAADVEPNRLTAAKRMAQPYVDALGDRDRMAIIAAGDQIEVACRLTKRKDLLHQALEGLTTTLGSTRAVEAVKLARQLLADGSESTVLLFTDGGFEGAVELAAGAGVELIPVGTSAGNLAVTRLSARRVPADPRRCQVLAEVTRFSARPAKGRLSLQLDDELIEAVSVEFPEGGRWQQVFEMTTPDGGTLTAALGPADRLPADDRASTAVPPAAIRRVTLVSDGSPPLESALGVDPSVELTVADKLPEQVVEGEILVFHGRVPDRLPRGPVLVVDPTGPCDWWQMGGPLDESVIVGQNHELPLLDRLRLEGRPWSAPQRLVLNDQSQPIAQPVAWTADGASMGYAMDRPEGRILVLAGVLDGGELPLGPGLPVLLANAVRWLGEPGDGIIDAHRPTVITGGRPAPGESDLRVPVGLASGVEKTAARPGGFPLWPYPAALAAIMLAVEWYLFQRRWIC
ncbi:MAG: vWA domain-containing protein [Planctomycetota bacterium]|jgi:Ca-activated chloride channel family protein